MSDNYSGVRVPRYSLLFFVFIVSPFAWAENVRLHVKGLSGELEQNVRARLSTVNTDLTINTDGVIADEGFYRRLDEALRQGLRALGYYDPTIDFEFKAKRSPGHSLLIVNVKQGVPVRIAGSDIVLKGEARQDSEYQMLLKKSRPKSGSILNHGHFSDFKASLLSLALRRGYFDAKMVKSQLAVAPQLHQAFWKMEFDSGQHYRFGNVLFQGSQIREDSLQNLVPFRQGEDYSAEKVGELNRRLASTGWFNSAVVSPNFRGAKKSGILPMDAVVTPRTRNTVELGGGYSSDVGVRFKTSWKKPWMNASGHSLTASADLSAPEQSLDVGYKIPLLRNSLEHYYLLQGGLKRSNLNDIASDTTMLSAARYWRLPGGWQSAINLHWSLDHYTQADVTATTMLLYPGVSINRTRQQGGMMPVWGDSQQYSVDVSSALWGSGTDFIRLQIQHVWIRTVAERHRFVLRGQIGWIEGDNFDRIPPSLRFFAGGDRSIRGYKYASLSPKDSEGKITGASKMLTGSLEYQYNVTDKWWGALFWDGGEAVNDIRQNDFKTGAGIGIRWASPAGAVKFDIAAPINSVNASRLEFYIGLGAEL